MASQTLPTTLKNPARTVRFWSFGAQLARFYIFWRKRVQRSRELGELYRLTVRDLHDMGLTRSDFPAIEKGIYRRDC
jgi:uncharacterized protein YjiS (DUF1127 family)